MGKAFDIGTVSFSVSFYHKRILERYKRFFFLLLPIIPFVKIKISGWISRMEIRAWISLYLFNFIYDLSVKSKDCHGAPEWTEWWRQWMLWRWGLYFLKSLLYCFGNINILNQFWWLFTFYLQNPETLLENNPEFFKKFTIVVATGLSER